METKSALNNAIPPKTPQTTGDWANRLGSLVILLLILGFGMFIVYYLFTATGGGGGL